LLYEGGWNKQLSYVIAFSPEEVVDVTRRYTIKYDEVLKRRADVGETFLDGAIKAINAQLDIFKVPERIFQLAERSQLEQQDLMSKSKQVDESELEGRISGSTEWKNSRGESGDTKLASKKKIIDFRNYPVAPNVLFRSTSFDTKSPIHCVGNATIDQNKLILTKAQNEQTGSVWWSQKLWIDDGFICLFQFKVTKNGADGFAFVIQGDSDKLIGKGGGHLGYDGISHAVAVEFDTYQNSDTNNDPNGNHISIQTCGEEKISSHHRSSLACVRYRFFHLDFVDSTDK
jgi:peptide-N4-(N-acetyl-beta-glucosaminyl)asparagine amidase